MVKATGYLYRNISFDDRPLWPLCDRKNMKQCYIIILNYKKWDETLDCIRSVFESDYTGFKVIAIDNDSGNRSLECIMDALEQEPVKKTGFDLPAGTALMDPQSFALMGAAVLPDISLVQNQRNGGFAAGNNVVIRSLMGEDAWLWLLNPDMTVDRHALTEMIRCGQQSPSGIVAAVHRSFYQPDKI